MSDRQEEAAVDIQSAHKLFSAQCFNAAWDLIEKESRSAADDEEMLRLSMASHWHWTQREDCAPSNLSVALWQLSRIYALLDRPDDARRHGQYSLEAVAAKGEPFFEGYAYEALARAEALAGEPDKAREYLLAANRLAEAIEDKQSRKFLRADLETIAIDD